MSQFEDELRAAFRIEDPPEGFVDRVMAAIPDHRKVVVIPRRKWSRSWLAAAAAVTLMVGGAGSLEMRRVERQRLERERAKAELVFALQITSEKLQRVRIKLLANSGEKL